MLISQNEILEIYEYEGEGYEKTMSFESWRVAIANHAERFDRALFERVERHTLTDEVFVLLCGSAQLVMGSLDGEKMKLEYIPLENGRLYNVKKMAWHNILMSKDAKVLIVENHNTGLENTEYFYLKGESENE